MHRFIIFGLLTTYSLNAITPAADGLNRFAGGLYRQLAGTSGNLVFSPLSISTALAMTLAGARGQTSQEITSVLRTPPDAALLDQLAEAGNIGGDQLVLSQSVWVDRAFALLPAFIHTNEKQFHAPPQTADFAQHSEDARNAINRWVNDKTKGKIAGLFAPGTLNRDTRLVLASAVYFNGKWESQFDAKSTSPGPFRTSSGASVNTRFMNQRARFPYAETPAAQVLELPYGGRSLAFDVILPKPGVALSTLEETLVSGSTSAWLGDLGVKQVAVSLPKFRAESALSLKGALSSMGMADAFTPAADFSGIDGRRDLSLSQVAHKAYIDVSEEGTEAAAATGSVMSLASYSQTLTFRADHPFLFLIRDTKTGVILFAGRFEAPKD